MYLIEFNVTVAKARQSWWLLDDSWGGEGASVHRSEYSGVIFVNFTHGYEISNHGSEHVVWVDVLVDSPQDQISKSYPTRDSTASYFDLLQNSKFYSYTKGGS